MVHALAYSAFAVIGPKPGIAAPLVDRYLLAFEVAAVVNLAGAPALTCLALRTRARSWAPVALGLGAGLAAAMVAACTLLLMLGVNPAEFALGL